MTKILDGHLFEKKQEFPKRRLYLAFTYAVLIFVGNILFLRLTTLTGAKANISQIMIASFGILMFLVMTTSLVIGLRSLLKIGGSQGRITKEFPDNRKAQIQSFCYRALQFSFIIWLLLLLVIVLDKTLQ